MISEELEQMDPFSLDAVVDRPSPQPVRAVIYGSHGIGKSTFGSNFPTPIVLFTEDGRRSIPVKHFPTVATTYSDVVKAITAVLSAPDRFQTFVLDSLDWTEPLIWAETCARNRWESIEDPGYGKGYLEADKVWAELFRGFDALRAAGLHVLILAHAEVTTFNPPESEPYNRYDLAVHKRARAMTHEWADVVGFAYEKTFVTQKTEGSGKSAKTITKGGGSGGRFLALERKSTHEAKNGFGLPPELPLTKDGETAAQLLSLITNSYGA